MALKDYPAWVLKHKEKNVELRCIKGRYTAYKVSYGWDPIKKRSKKITGEYLGVITQEGIIPPKNKLTSLNKNDKVLRDLQILKELEAGKEKTKIAKNYNITTKTIDNIKLRFDEDGVQGLIHTRTSKYETVKVSSPEQAAIITDFVQNPQKEAKEIKKTTGVKTSINVINEYIKPVKELLTSKKKLLLEIIK